RELRSDSRFAARTVVDKLTESVTLAGVPGTNPAHHRDAVRHQGASLGWILQLRAACLPEGTLRRDVPADPGVPTNHDLCADRGAEQVRCAHRGDRHDGAGPDPVPLRHREPAIPVRRSGAVHVLRYERVRTLCTGGLLVDLLLVRLR